MEYTNPEIPEGINAGKENPLKEFLILTAGVIGIIVLAVVILSFLAERLAVYVPFSIEQELVAAAHIGEDTNEEIENYLQGISDQLTRHLKLPEDMSFTIHYSEEPVENAFATIGGHIYIYQGLLELLPNENTLTMVIAHEMAHIYHRHPIIALGRGVVIGLLLAAVSGLSGDYFVGQVVNDAGIITLLTFYRDQEREADGTALAMVAAHYGHIAGTDELFKVMLELLNKEPVKMPLFLSTHPLSQERLSNIRQLAEKNNWDTSGDITAIPAFIRNQSNNISN